MNAWWGDRYTLSWRKNSRMDGSVAIRTLALLAALFAIPTLAIAEVTVADPWVRGTVAPQKATGAFMKLTSPTDAALVSASSPAARQVEIHEMVMVNNVMRMRPVRELALPAGKEVALKPGGYHVMLTGIEHQFKQGDVVPITLTIRGKDGKTQTVEVKAPVRDLTASSTPKPAMEGMRH
jgi:copper(I)-binding protein